MYKTYYSESFKDFDKDYSYAVYARTEAEAAELIAHQKLFQKVDFLPTANQWYRFGKMKHASPSTNKMFGYSSDYKLDSQAMRGDLSVYYKFYTIEDWRKFVEEVQGKEVKTEPAVNDNYTIF